MEDIIMTMESLTTFFGWCAVLNIAYLIIATIMIASLKDWMFGIHGKLFGITKEVAFPKYFMFVAKYKILTLIFSVVPWVALKIMA
jgi:hypothetical protein